MDKRIKDKDKKIQQQDEKIVDLQEAGIAQWNKHEQELSSQKATYEHHSADQKKRLDDWENTCSTYKA